MEDPTPIMTQGYLGSAQREAKVNRQAVQPTGELFKRITAAEPTDEKDQTKEPPSSEKITAWSYDMQEHAEKSEERCCELANQTASSLQLVATPCIDDHSQPGYILNRRVFVMILWHADTRRFNDTYFLLNEV